VVGNRQRDSCLSRPPSQVRILSGRQ
jgi:hypothetical protein